MRRLAALAVLLSMPPALAAGGFPERKYLCIVNGVDDFTRDFAPPQPQDDRMACTGTIHYTLKTPQAALVSEVTAALDAAETSGYPVYLTFDDWNFPPPEWAMDPEITEWTGWDGTLCAGRDIEWQSDNPQNPPPNFESPSLRALLAPKLDAVFSTIATRARQWEAQGRGHLFAGIALGWESGYYTEFDGVAPFRTGFAALTSKGLLDADIAAGAVARGVTYSEEFDSQMYRVVHDYVAWWSARAVAAGIPRERITTHFTGVPDDWVAPDPARRDGRLVPFSLAGNGYARPGHTATPEWIDLERLATEAGARGTPEWGAPEWEATTQKSSRDAMLQYLSRLYRFGAAVTNNWGGWWGPGNPYRINGSPGEQGMKDWLSGSDLPGVGVRVGRSTLAGPLDYSDSWTEGTRGRVADGSFPVVGAAVEIESNYGNPTRVWSGAKWSFRKDGNLFWTPASPDPRGNWSGSRSGITETGGGVDFGIEYGLRDDYVIQLDAVQTDGRIAITSAGARDTTARSDGISVFFHPAGAAIEIGIYNVGVGERDTGFRPALARNVFHNYAVRFRLPTKELWIYADERRLGVVDLDTFAGGAFAGVPVTNAAVTVGATVVLNNRVWTDNFQVGAPCPTPPVVEAIRLRREGDDVLLDWRIDPAIAYSWRVYALSGPDLSQRTLLGSPFEKTWRDTGGATGGTDRYYRVEAANDCEGSSLQRTSWKWGQQPFSSLPRNGHRESGRRTVAVPISKTFVEDLTP